MHLLIKNPNGLDIKEFVNWVADDISTHAKVNAARIPELEEVWDNYFQTTDLGWAKDETGNPSAPTVNYIIHQFFDNLKITQFGQDYDISTDQELKIVGTSLTIDMLASMINFGTLDLPAYNYFDVVFEVYADQLQDLYDYWVEEVQGRKVSASANKEK